MALENNNQNNRIQVNLDSIVNLEYSLKIHVLFLNFRWSDFGDEENRKFLPIIFPFHMLPIFLIIFYFNSQIVFYLLKARGLKIIYLCCMSKGDHRFSSQNFRAHQISEQIGYG